MGLIRGAGCELGRPRDGKSECGGGRMLLNEVNGLFVELWDDPGKSSL